MVEAWVALSFSASMILGCGSVSTQLTGYGEQMKVKRKPGPCRTHVFYTHATIPPHLPVATLQYDQGTGLFAADAEATTDAFRQAACDLGADGVVVENATYQTFGSGTHATATAFVWARFPPPPPPAGSLPPATTTPPVRTPVATCEPACRDGFACVKGQCVSACNPACAPNEQCTTLGSIPRCAAREAPKPVVTSP